MFDMTTKSPKTVFDPVLKALTEEASPSSSRKSFQEKIYTFIFGMKVYIFIFNI